MATSPQAGSERGSTDDVTKDKNMENRLNAVDNKLLTARLECAIEGDSVSDVRAAIEKGAPVNFLYKVKSTYVFKFEHYMPVDFICTEIWRFTIMYCGDFVENSLC